MDNRLLEIEKNLDSITIDLIGPIRMSKTINRGAFDKLYSLLEELVVMLKGQNMVPRRLVGKIFKIYILLVGESSHTKYPEPIFIESARVESYLDEILNSK